jgi:hypothetical protein
MTGIKIGRLDRKQDAKLAEPYEQVLVQVKGISLYSSAF